MKKLARAEVQEWRNELRIEVDLTRGRSYEASDRHRQVAFSRLAFEQQPQICLSDLNRSFLEARRFVADGAFFGTPACGVPTRLAEDGDIARPDPVFADGKKHIERFLIGAPLPGERSRWRRDVGGRGEEEAVVEAPPNAAHRHVAAAQSVAIDLEIGQSPGKLVQCAHLTLH